MSPGAVDLVEEKAFVRLRRLISVDAAVFDSELLCHRVGQFFHVMVLLRIFGAATPAGRGLFCTNQTGVASKSGEKLATL